MNFDAYSLAHLQNMEQMCAQFEGEGITDLRFVRQRLSDAIRNRALSYKKVSLSALVKGRREMTKRGRIGVVKDVCPSCGSPMVQVINSEGLQIIGCKRCRYSEVV